MGESELRNSIAAELWFFPDVLEHARAFLLQLGISLTGEQQTKTRKALEYFASLHSKGRKSPRAAA